MGRAWLFNTYYLIYTRLLSVPTASWLKCTLKSKYNLLNHRIIIEYLSFGPKIMISEKILQVKRETAADTFFILKAEGKMLIEALLMLAQPL